jgi:epoxyqueuosine reductase QueG
MDLEARKQLTAELKAFAVELDIDLFGVAALDELNKHGKPGRRPSDLWPRAKAIIATACGNLDTVSRVWAQPQEDLTSGLSTVPLNMLEARGLRINRWLRQKGYEAHDYHSAKGRFGVHFRQAHAFQQAGLGYVGKSQLAISEKYGPRQHIWTIMTDAPLVPDEPYTEDHCGSCDICELHCSSTAIMGDGFFNARLCEAVVNCKPTASCYYSLGGWADCDMCQRMCPQGEYKWPAMERIGMWWDHVRLNREDTISHSSRYLQDAD